MTDVSSPAEPTAAEPAQGGLRRLIARFEHLIRELGKFGAVGGIAFAVDFAIVNTLWRLGVEPLTAATISMTIAATVAFIGNRFWTWRDRERSGLRREYTLYFLFNLVGLAIGLICLGVCVYGLGSVWPVFQGDIAKNVAKNGVGMALGTAFRFWSYRQIVFRR